MVNDLISKKDLMKQAFSVYYPLEGENYIKVIRLEDVEKAPTEPRWIPVIEKLPEEDGCYIVTTKIPFYENGAYGYITGAAYYISCVMKWYDANGEVIAWMPLPEPYTEVNDGKDTVKV